MSAVDFSRIGNVVEFLGEQVPDLCFYCAKPLSGMTAFWHGTGSYIAMHPDCGVEFGARVIRDSLNAKYIGLGRDALAGVEK